MYDKMSHLSLKFLLNQTQLVQPIPRPGLREQSNKHMRFLNEKKKKKFN